MIDFNKNDESLLLLLELADKYMDANKIGKKNTEKNEAAEDDNAVTANESVTKAEKIEPVIKQTEVNKNYSKKEGEDAEFMFSILAGEHFITPEEVKESGEEGRKKLEEEIKKKELNEEEKKKMEKAQNLINKSGINTQESPEKEKGDVEMLLKVMDVYMDIYKP